MKNYELTSFTDNFFSPFFERASKNFQYWGEEDNKYHLQVELPGVEKEDINVSVEEGYVEVNATKKVKTKHGETSRSYQNYFTLPTGLDVEAIECEYKNGVLTLWAPKKVEAQKKTLTIK